MTDSKPTAKSNPGVQWYIWAALAFVVLRLWIQPITYSLELDETGTFLLVQGTFSEMLKKCAEWAGQPTYFIAMVWPFAQLPGPREVVLRLPSFIGLAVATVFVYRIGMRLLGSEPAGIATLIFAALGAYYAYDARPYALGLMAASGAILFLIRWMDGGKLMDAIGYAFFAALTVYFHFLFGCMFLVHGGYILLRYRQGTRARLRDLVLAGALIPTLLIPLVPNLLRVTSVRGSFNFISKPRLVSIVLDSVPEYFYGFLVAGLLAAVLLCSGVTFRRPNFSAPEFRLLIGWALVPPSALFLVSLLTSTAVFLDRYFSVALPGLALFLAYIISGFEPVASRSILVLTLAVGAILDQGGSLRTLSHRTENWRDGLAAANELIKSQPMPVLMRSGFVESTDAATLADPAKAELLLAPLSAYPIAGPVIPLPFRATAQSYERLESIVGKKLLPSGRFLLISSRGHEYYRIWLEGRLHAESFTNREIGRFGVITLDLFEKK